jgi:hypothetical protein
MKADKKIVAKLTKGLQGQKEYEASVIERMNRTHSGASWFFVSKLNAFSRCERILVSVPHD